MSILLCAVLRPESERAVALAGDLATRLALELALVDIRPTPHDLVATPTMGAVPPPSPPRADLAALAEGAGVHPDRCDFIEAPPAAALETLSARPEVEILVASDSGGGPLVTALTGEAPRSALRHLHAPLVLVPEHDRRTAALTEPPSIACAVLDDETAVAAATVAVDLSRRLGAALRFVHAGDDEDAPLRIEERIGAALPKDRAATLEVIPRDQAHELHAWAGARGADLLVTGPPRRGALGSALLGSVVHSASQHGTIPVVVAPRPSSVV
jgi:nucleotide-binding universal stress UspA family protein